jgi:hypothetical protein
LLRITLWRIVGSPKPQRMPPPPALATLSSIEAASLPSMMLCWMIGAENSQRMPPPSRYQSLCRGSSQRVPRPPLMVNPWMTVVESSPPSMMSTLAVSGFLGRLPSRIVRAITLRSFRRANSLVSTMFRPRSWRFS